MSLDLSFIGFFVLGQKVLECLYKFCWIPSFTALLPIEN
jgi:hypothetical protein